MAVTRRLVTGALLGACVAGCTTQEINVRERDPQGFLPWSDAPAPYRLGAGDKLKFVWPLTPENDEEVFVGPDGYIGLRIAGRVRAAGLSVDEVQTAVQEAAASRLKTPMVVASIVDARASRIVVGGAVRQPGVYTMPARPTVFEAITTAGGLNIEARMDQIIVLRLRPDNTAMLKTVNLQNFIAKGAMGENLMLHAEDMIFVPRSRVGELNNWIEQYVNRNLPFGRQLTFTRQENIP